MNKELLLLIIEVLKKKRQSSKEDQDQLNHRLKQKKIHDMMYGEDESKDPGIQTYYDNVD